MPVEQCTINGQSGYRWGKAGKCYTGKDAKKKAAQQGAAIEANGGEDMTKDIEQVELFAVGKWNGMAFSQDDLESIAAAFRELGDNHRVPLKFGHNDDQPMTDGQPALGWVSDIWVEANKLWGRFTDVPEIVYKAISKKLYSKVSVELDIGVQWRGESFPFVLSGVALLGADIPAVNTLSDLSAYMGRGEGLTAQRRFSFSRFVSNDKEMEMSNDVEKLQNQLDLIREELAKANEAKIQFSKDAEQAQAEVNRMQAEAEKAKFAAAKETIAADLDRLVKDSKITPAVREEMLGQFEETDAAISSLKFAISMLGKVESKGLPQNGGRSGDGTVGDLPPDTALTNKINEYMIANGGVSFAAARERVMRADPDLARDYIDMNGRKEG